MKPVTLLLSAALSISLAACGSSDPAAEATDAAGVAGASPTATTAGMEPTGAPMAATAQAFVDAAGASDTFELESSRLAATMAQDAKVKDFARMMVTDHTKSTADLKAAAAQAVPPVTVNPQMTPEQQADLEQLQAAGENFDRIYGQKQVAAHEKALALLQSYAASGEAQPLKDFASKTAPVVSGHLAHARTLPR